MRSVISQVRDWGQGIVLFLEMDPPMFESLGTFSQMGDQAVDIILLYGHGVRFKE